MSRLRFVIASLLLSSAVGCAAATAGTGSATMKPVVVQPAKPTIDRAALRAKLVERRAITMAHFLAYRENRVYPSNTLGGTRHIWQDDSGNLCAAATLISYDWGRPSTENVGKENRQIALAKVTSGPLADWILTSGLTHHEIVAIQVPGSDMFPDVQRVRSPEIERLYGIYIDVERQLTGLSDESLDAATDALMKRPELARELLAGRVASAGKYTAKTDVATR